MCTIEKKAEEYKSTSPMILVTYTKITKVNLLKSNHHLTRNLKMFFSIYRPAFSFHIIMGICKLDLLSYQGFLSRTFTIHRTAGEGGGCLFNFSLPLPLDSQTLRHLPGDYCRELTTAHS